MVDRASADPPEQCPDDAWPRVLFLTPCAFNGVTGGGVTFSNLFRGWPKDRLACVTSDTVPVSREVCERYFQLGAAERRRVGLGGRFAPVRLVGGEMREVGTKDTSTPTSPTPAAATPGPARRLVTRLLGTAGLPEAGVLSDRLRAWVDDFQPDVVYTILGDQAMIDLAEQMSETLGLPLVLHCMDEGVTEPARTGWYGRRFNAGYRAGFRRLVDRAADRLAICDAMADRYAQRYARPFASFHNAAEVERVFAYHRPATELRNDPPRVLYAGSIYPIAQDRSLLDCCAAVQRLNRSGTPVELHVHASRTLFGQYAPQVEAFDGCAFHEALDDDPAFFEAITSADVLLLPANFDAESVRYIGLSMPTKVPAYLASGTPTLVYAPRSVAQVRAAAEDGWGMIVDEQATPGTSRAPLLDDALRVLLADGALRQRLADDAAVIAREHHDAPTVRRRFRDTLRRAAEPRG